MRIIAKKEFTLNGKYYVKGDEVKVNSKDELVKLNEKGFIEPLNRKEVETYFFKKNENKEEE